MNDNFNTTWYLINNPAPYVRKNETFNIQLIVDKTEEKTKLQNKTQGLCEQAEAILSLNLKSCEICIDNNN